MSIIYDALKKVENSDGLASINKFKDTRGKVSKRNFILYVFALGCGIILANAIFSIFSRPTPGIRVAGIKAKSAAAAIARQDLPIAETYVPPVADEPKSPKLVLSGVFFSQTSSCAIINNQIVKEGDIIEGVIVKRINPDDVVLESSGVPFTLSSSK
ncbi:MAG: general secretion pathway protein GspB [Candidatus Omnitrophota bacterium]